MGGYGTYLGFRIRFSDDAVSANSCQLTPIEETFLDFVTQYNMALKSETCQEEKAKAKDLHPKLLGGMFFFFALGATGGVTSLLTSDRPIFERYSLFWLLSVH